MHMSTFCDAILVLDDLSEDDTVVIAAQCPKVIEIIRHKIWQTERVMEETVHRQMLLERARKYNVKWIFCFDADERYEINKSEILSLPSSVDAVKIKLFDAYMTIDDYEPYQKGGKLYNLRKFFGPESRDILMLFRNTKNFVFSGGIAREPIGHTKLVYKFYAQHYGKALSLEQWEETCDYYSTYFPEPYTTKWKNRKGKGVHTESDFGCPLYSWDDVKAKAVPID